ncbi:MAG: DUF188 domain-containing protein [Spirochaetaceae bacterium]|jgi:uncharacterized protein YaiI (UPF0178 family)|nr:DUF188 domain-containing protein [Spirochaetaceae bacterium]
MKILVDADSCPVPARELILRAAARTETTAVFAANRPIPGVGGPWARMLTCPPGEGAADDRLVEIAESGDLAVTRDISLALRLLEAGAEVLDDRGRVFTPGAIREFLSLRNFTLGLVENGYDFERSPGYGKKELKTFAGSFDGLLTKLRRRVP